MPIFTLIIMYRSRITLMNAASEQQNEKKPNEGK